MIVFYYFTYHSEKNIYTAKASKKNDRNGDSKKTLLSNRRLRKGSGKLKSRMDFCLEIRIQTSWNRFFVTKRRKHGDSPLEKQMSCKKWKTL